jgi:hypothetical protein
MIPVIKNFLEKRKYKNVLEKYVSKEAARAIVEGKALPDLGIRAGRIEFVLAFVRGDSVEQNSERIALVSDLAMKHEWIVENMVSSLLIVTFGYGLLHATQHSASSRTIFVNDLLQQLSGDIKIVHGATAGHFGNFGSSKRMAYTFLVPKFDLALARLGQIEFGKIEEFIF